MCMNIVVVSMHTFFRVRLRTVNSPSVAQRVLAAGRQVGKAWEGIR